MKVSEILVSDVVEYLKLEDGEYKEFDILTLIATSRAFIRSYTGLGDELIDIHEDFYIVVMVLCQDMHDSRSLYVEKNNLNKVVETILGMHSINLL